MHLQLVILSAKPVHGRQLNVYSHCQQCCVQRQRRHLLCTHISANCKASTALVIHPLPVIHCTKTVNGLLLCTHNFPWLFLQIQFTNPSFASIPCTHCHLLFLQIRYMVICYTPIASRQYIVCYINSAVLQPNPVTGFGQRTAEFI